MEKHIRQILSELSNSQHLTEEEKENIKRKDRIFNKIYCPSCGSEKQCSTDICAICEIRKQMELGEYI